MFHLYMSSAFSTSAYNFEQITYNTIISVNVHLFISIDLQVNIQNRGR